jgi:hypothetical protein
LQAEGYPGPLLDLTSTARSAGKHVLKLQIEPKAPQGFKPVVITDAK